jgi:hypothetical protein
MIKRLFVLKQFKNSLTFPDASDSLSGFVRVLPGLLTEPKIEKTFKFVVSGPLQLMMHFRSTHERT